MIIGSFTYNKKQDTYLGDIKTLNFDAHSVAFKPVERRTDKEPDYRITAPTEYGNVELGAGWKRTSDKGRPSCPSHSMARCFLALSTPRSSLKTRATPPP